jgi:hypothetical protein
MVCRTWTGRRLVERYAAAVVPYCRNDDETDWTKLHEAIDTALRCPVCARRFQIPVTALREFLYDGP